MDIEHSEPTIDPVETEPTTVAPSEIDPSIDATNLVVQDGENMGAVNAFETERGTSLEDNGEKKDIPDSEQPYTVEGLPVIGAEAEEKARNEIKEIGEPAVYPEHTRPFEPGEMEVYVDKQGTEAMATEVRNKAVELATKQFPLASEDLVAQFGDKAVNKFKAELETKNAKIEAKHDQGVMNLMNSLDSPDKKLSEVIPDVPEAAEDTGYIDTTIESPTPGHN